ncbi:MAG TPA: hypothetical protein VM307_10820 [Egibacteraceae bacterium]|nr:hypothetical protein [Egibacteraceae bacterium]
MLDAAAHAVAPRAPDSEVSGGTSGAQQPRLPIWRAAVFFDWHGVMSSDRFWWSILNNPSHTFHGRLAALSTRLFRQSELVNAWMRGTVTSRSVVASMPVTTTRWNTSFLYRRLVEDCGAMPLDRDMGCIADSARADAFVALATDNMDCFNERAGRRRDLRRLFDEVLCSSSLGVLKAEDPAAFFGPTLESVGLSFSDAVLVDDDDGNCAAFERAGGRAIRHRSADATREQLDALLTTT